MANRPIFISDNYLYVKSENIEFKWYPGFAKIQKQNSYKSLHEAALKKYPNLKFLEVSSSSENELGRKLSAFNLSFLLENDKNQFVTVESMFQGSKIFERGGPFIDLYKRDSITAKKDPRLKTSGNLMQFKLKSRIFDLEPKTFFYDWLYMNTLLKNISLIKELIQYDAFTDIEFNPNKSINCQARTVAIFVSLYKKNKLHLIYDKNLDELKQIYKYIEYNH